MIKIVPFKSEHTKQIYKIETMCFSIPWAKKIFEKIPEVPYIHFYTALDEDNVVGYCGLNHVLDEGQIINIAVHPDYRRRGIGDMLMNQMIEYAESNDIKVLTLEVRESNLSARKMYEKYGFYDVGIRPRYYQDPLEDAVLMNKDI